MLDQTFDALKKYDWGQDPEVLKPINDALISTREDDAARKELEATLTAILTDDVPRAAKDFVCRKLRVIGTDDCVPALASLLADKDLSHMARYALERIPTPGAAKALREALPKVENAQKVGIISSLGVRQDTDSVNALAGVLSDSFNPVAKAAAIALGAIHTAAAAKALSKSKHLAAIDASLCCAEALLADGKRLDALAIYNGLAGDEQPKHIRMAATRGKLACLAKK
ncbi:MAG: HEAT repeat domain-containing protein [Pirellulaceae bacterium]|nr:HEAT repeat domain-containing protein [Pirellulaceae bacterium]